MITPAPGLVTAVSLNSRHKFSKANQLSIRLLAGRGVEGDAHCGTTVQHVYDRGRDPERPNLRQVHLMHEELFDELKDQGFSVGPGDLGENVTTCGLDLLGLPEGTRLHLGETAIVEVTGLRAPCVQIDRFQKGLMRAMLGRDPANRVIRKAGIMSVVIAGGEIRCGDPIEVELPPEPHRMLVPV